MPINIPSSLPAKEILECENIFVMDEEKAVKQDIRPLKIIILNLMPTKIVTETQILRLLSNTPLQIDITLLRVVSHKSKNTSKEHLDCFYRDYESIKHNKFDGMIVTGAPIEKINYDDVDYWDEFCEIIDWAKHNVYTVMYVCWGAFAGLYKNYGIEKHAFDKKLFGVFEHSNLVPSHPLVRGYLDKFYVPHSRYMYIKREDIDNNDNLLLLSYSDTAGVYLAVSKDAREVYITGHPEYDTETLLNEYLRDVANGVSEDIPENYFENDDPKSPPLNKWKSHGHLLYSNWINYFVYQETLYNLELL